MRVYLTEIFTIISGISNYDRHFLNISPQTSNLLSRQISKTKSTTNWNFLQIELNILGTNCLIRSKTTIMKKVLRLNWLVSEKIKKKNFRGHFFLYYWMDYLIEFGLFTDIELTGYKFYYIFFF